MGTTIQARQKWTLENYDQIKVSVPKELARDFKKECNGSNIPMARVLKQAMLDFCGQKKPKVKLGPQKPQVDTRQKRRKAISFALEIIKDARDAEATYLMAIPVNPQNSSRYEDAESCVAALDEAVQVLEDAYS
jgi:hypothetical protein